MQNASEMTDGDDIDLKLALGHMRRLEKQGDLPALFYQVFCPHADICKTSKISLIRSKEVQRALEGAKTRKKAGRALSR